MRHSIPIIRPVVLLMLVLALALLTTVGSCLYSENRYYKKANRELIIQNDSIISVNILLKSAVHGQLNSASRSESFGSTNTK